MTSSEELLQYVFNSDNNSIITGYLESCSELRLFQQKDSIKCAVAFANELLNEAQTREKGFLLLKYVLSQTSRDLILANINTWMQHCLKTFEKHDKRSCYLALELLGILLCHSIEYPEIRRETATSVIPKFLETLNDKLKNDFECSYSVLECVEKCLSLYGKSCFKAKAYLERKLISLVDRSPDVVQMAGRCFLQLCQVGPPGLNGENHKTNWKERNLYLIQSMHKVLDVLFENVNEIQGNNRLAYKTLEGPSLPSVGGKFQLLKVQKLSTQFRSLACFVETMILGSYPYGKMVSPNALLSVVCRTLAVTSTTLLARPSSESIALSNEISNLHLVSLNILEALIRCCRMNLVKHGPLICKLVTQSLKWTNTGDCPYGQDKPFISLRVASYNCLSEWVTVCQCASQLENNVDELLHSILSDIQYNKPSVTLTAPKEKKKKRKRNKNVELLMSDKMDPKNNFTLNKLANKDVCSAALKTLSLVFKASSTLIHPKLHEMMQTNIVKQLLMIQQSNADPPLPYSDETCRLALYTSLLSLVNNFHPQCPPPIEYSQSIFSRGCRDSSTEVARYCLSACDCLEKLVRPAFTPMNFVLNPYKQQEFQNKVSTDIRPLLAHSVEKEVAQESLEEKITEEEPVDLKKCNGDVSTTMEVLSEKQVPVCETENESKYVYISDDSIEEIPQSKTDDTEDKAVEKEEKASSTNIDKDHETLDDDFERPSKQQKLDESVDLTLDANNSHVESDEEEMMSSFVDALNE